MEMTRKQTQFWVAILILCLVVAVAITLVDFSIKAAILEESNRLRKVIEDYGRIPESANAPGANNDTDNDPPLPGSILVDKPTGMEATNAPNGIAKSSRNSGTRRAQPGRQARTRTIQNGDK